jgi:hypothetical protein
MEKELQIKSTLNKPHVSHAADKTREAAVRARYGLSHLTAPHSNPLVQKTNKTSLTRNTISDHVNDLLALSEEFQA